MSEPAVEIQQAKSREEIAMGKLIDPFSEPYPYYHVLNISKLESVLKYGLVAGEFAEKVGVSGYSSDYGSSWNRKNVSLSKDPMNTYWKWFGSTIALIVRPREEPTRADNDVKENGDGYSPDRDEFLIRHRITPDEFIGIAFEKSDVPEPISVESIAEILERSDPKLALPIYGRSGLTWPYEMTRKELKDRVQSQHEI